MGRKKKEGGALSYPLKVTDEFGKKLALVADDFGKHPGEVIEERLNTWVSGEYLRVLESKLAKAREEAKRK